jgi:hypothetical protein
LAHGGAYGQVDVAYALVRAASRLLATPALTGANL